MENGYEKRSSQFKLQRIPGGGGDSQINITGMIVEIVEKHP